MEIVTLAKASYTVALQTQRHPVNHVNVGIRPSLPTCGKLIIFVVIQEEEKVHLGALQNKVVFSVNKHVIFLNVVSELTIDLKFETL